MRLELEGKVALITGGSEGIGRVSAATLAGEGASVVICARRKDVLERAASEIREETGGEVVAVPADVTVAEQIDHLFGVVETRYGALDILLNNAGRHMSGHFMDMTDEQWYGDLDLKLMAAVRCSRLAVPLMRRRGGGHIINITTPLGKAPSAGSVPTSVSRAAGIALTKANVLRPSRRQYPRQHRVHRPRQERADAESADGEGHVARGAVRRPGEERASRAGRGDSGGGGPYSIPGVREGQLRHGLRDQPRRGLLCGRLDPRHVHLPPQPGVEMVAERVAQQIEGRGRRRISRGRGR